jgi:hypothetical protein
MLGRTFFVRFFVRGVGIPDCPGAFGAGETPEGAIRDATIGLAAWAKATFLTRPGASRTATSRS